MQVEQGVGGRPRDEGLPGHLSLSIVIPTHRMRGYIRATIDSVLPQLREGDEIIIVANGCDDAYHAYLIDQFAARAHIVRLAEGGVALARNAGLRVASGDLVMFLDDDDALTPQALDVHRAAFRADPELAAVVGTVITFGDGGESILRDATEDTPVTFRMVLMEGPPAISPGAGSIRRSVLEQIGGLREDLAPADDWELWLRLSERFRVTAVATPTLRYRYHGTRASLNVSRMAHSALRVLRLYEARLTGADAALVRANAAMQLRSWYFPKQRQALAENARFLHIGNAAFDCAMMTRIFVHELDARVRRRLGLLGSRG